MTTEASPQTLPEVVAFARANGLTKVKFGDIEVELGPAPAAAAASTSVEEAFEDEGPSDLELLLWSTGDGPATQMEVKAYYAAHPEAEPKPKRKHRATKKV